MNGSNGNIRNCLYLTSIWSCFLFLKAKQFGDLQDLIGAIYFGMLFTFMMFILHPLKGVNIMGFTAWLPNSIFTLYFIYTVHFFGASFKAPLLHVSWESQSGVLCESLSFSLPFKSYGKRKLKK